MQVIGFDKFDYDFFRKIKTPPTISSLTNFTTTNQSVIVSWTVNESSNYTLTIGICPSFTNTNSFNVQ